MEIRRLVPGDEEVVSALVTREPLGGRGRRYGLDWLANNRASQGRKERSH
jgi:hypothetical protein